MVEGGTIILKNAHFSPPNSDQKGNNVRIQRIEGMTVEPFKKSTLFHNLKISRNPEEKKYILTTLLW